MTFSIKIPTFFADKHYSQAYSGGRKLKIFLGLNPNFCKQVQASTQTANSYILDNYVGIMILVNYPAVPSFNCNSSIKREAICKTVKDPLEQWL